MSQKTFTFLLIGKTGSGKSSVGNAILGENVFVTSDNETSETSDISIQNKQRSGFNINVIDTPGIMDTHIDEDEGKSKACENMRKAMNECPTTGKLALILVLRYGDRFTIENMKSLKILKAIYGKKYFWKSCIIVFTYGDCFQLKYKGKKNLTEWISEQKDKLQKLLEKCNNRCVLFSNLTEEQSIGNDQFIQLIQNVTHLDQTYTLNKFNKAKKEQNRLELEAKLEDLNEYFNNIIKDSQMNAIKCRSVEELSELESKIIERLDTLNKMDEPETIYYQEGENRLLENIRTSFNALLALISKRKEHILQDSAKNMFDLEIENLIKQIKETNPKLQETSESIAKLNCLFNQLESKISDSKLKDKFKDSLFINMNKAKDLLSTLEKEFHIFKENEIDQTLRELKNDIEQLDTESVQFKEYVDELNDLLNGLDLEIEQTKIRLLMKDQMKEKLRNLKSSLSQMTLANQYNSEIDNIINLIHCTDKITEEDLDKFRFRIQLVEYNVNRNQLSENIREKVKLKRLIQVMMIVEFEQLSKGIEEIDPKKSENISIINKRIEDLERIKFIIKENDLLKIFHTNLRSTKEMLDSLKDRCEIFKKKINELIELENKFVQLGLPCLVSRFSELKMQADVLKKQIEEDIENKSDKNELLKLLDTLTEAIGCFKIENDMVIGWTVTRTITAALSVPLVFVPVVGPLIFAALHTVPVIGQALHAKIERRRQRKQKELKEADDKVSK